jgi:hypothetical protein
MVRDLPLAIDFAPHVREAGLDGAAVALRSNHERVHARVQVGIVAVVLHIVSCDVALWQLLQELHEVLLGG